MAAEVNEGFPVQAWTEAFAKTVSTNETPAEAFAKAVAASEDDLMRVMDAMGRPELKDELREFLQDLSKAVAEAQNDG
jgi:hypothetical protein